MPKCTDGGGLRNENGGLNALVAGGLRDENGGPNKRGSTDGRDLCRE